MKKPFVCLRLFALLVALGVPAEAQQGGKLFKIGSILSGTASRPNGGFLALRREIRALGYVEGNNAYVLVIPDVPAAPNVQAGSTNS